MHRTTIAKYTKFSADELQNSLSDPLSCVAAVQLNEILSLRPRDCEHIVKGVRRCVTDKIGRYHAKVNGIVLGYAKIRIDNALSALRLDSPYLHVRATIDYFVFQPRIGSTLRGTVNYVSKEFVSAMIYRVFNVTVKLGKNVNKQQTVKRGSDITFTVKSCDMKSEIPVIEGELVVDGIPAVEIKQEPDTDSNEEAAVQDHSTSKAKKSEKQKEPVKEKTKKKSVVPPTQPDDAAAADSSEDSDDSTDEKSLLIKSLINQMFGDQLTNGDSSKKEKKKKKKTPKNTTPAKEVSSSPVVVRVKQEPSSTDEEESVDSGHSTSQSNESILTTSATSSSKKKVQSTGTVEKKRKKIRFDPNDTITYIKTEPTESRKKKKSVTE